MQGRTPWILGFLICFLIGGASRAEDRREVSSVRVLYFSDLHGWVFSNPRIGKAASQVNAGGLGQLLTHAHSRPHDLFMFGGDVDEGGGQETLIEPNEVSRILAEQGKLSVRSPGNHDNQLGLEQFIERERIYFEAGVPTVCANLKGIPGWKEAEEFNVRGLKVVVTALLPEEDTDLRTYERFAKEMARRPTGLPAARESFSFEDPFHAAQRMARRYAGKADLLLVMAHLGSKKSYKHNVLKLAEEVPGFRAIFSGHSHQAFEKPLRVNNTSIVEAGAMGAFLGEMEFLQRRNGSGSLEPIDERWTLHRIDEAMPISLPLAQRIGAFRSRIDAKVNLFEVIAYLPPPFWIVADRERDVSMLGKAPYLNLNDLLASALLNNRQPGREIDGVFLRGGGIRNSIPPGDIVRKQSWEPRPFGSVEFPDYPIVEVRGADLQRVFDQLMKADPTTRFALNSDLNVDPIGEVEGGETKLVLRYRNRAIPVDKLFRIALDGFTTARTLKNSRYLAGQAPLIDGKLAFEHFLHEHFPPRVTAAARPGILEQARSTLSILMERVRGWLQPRALTSVGEEVATASDAKAFMWDYHRRTAGEILVGYFALSAEVESYQTKALEGLETAKNYYAERARNPSKNGDAVKDPETSSQLHRMLSAQRKKLIRTINDLRVEIWKGGADFEKQMSTAHHGRALNELNTLRGRVDETLTQLDLQLWDWQLRRLELAGDIEILRRYQTDRIAETGSPLVQKYFDEALKQIADADVRMAARYCLERVPQSFWIASALDANGERELLKGLRGGAPEQSVRVMTELLKFQKTGEHQAALIRSIATRPYLRALAEKIGPEKAMNLLRSYELFSALMLDAFPFGRAESATARTSSHEAYPPMLLRALLQEESLKGKLDPYLVEFFGQAMLHHHGAQSVGEIGRSYMTLEPLLGHLFTADRNERLRTVEKVYRGGEVLPILEMASIPSIPIVPRYNESRDRVEWENVVTHEVYDSAYLQERVRTGDMEEVKEGKRILRTPLGTVTVSPYKLYARNAYRSDSAASRLIPDGSGNYFDLTNPYSAIYHESEILPHAQMVERHGGVSRFLLPAGTATENQLPYRVTVKGKPTVSFSLLLDADLFASQMRGRVQWVDIDFPRTPDPKKNFESSKGYEIERRKTDFADRAFAKELSGFVHPDLQEAARYAVETAQHDYEFIPAFATTAREHDVGYRDFGGMTMYVRETIRALESILVANRANPTPSRLADLARLALLVRRSAEHGPSGRQFDSPAFHEDPLHRTLGYAELGWPHPVTYVVSSPNSTRIFDDAEKAERYREQLTARPHEGPVKHEIREGFYAQEMLSHLSEMGWMEPSQFQVLIEALRLAHEAEHHHQPALERIVHESGNVVGELADLIVRAESTVRFAATRTKNLVLASGTEETHPWYQGRARNIYFVPEEGPDGIVRYRNTHSGQLFERSQMEGGWFGASKIATATREIFVRQDDGSGWTLKKEPFARRLRGHDFLVRYIEGPPSLFEPVVAEGEVKWRNIYFNHDPLYTVTQRERQPSWVPLRESPPLRGYGIVRSRDRRREIYWNLEEAKRRRTELGEASGQIEPLGYFVEAGGVRAYVLTHEQAEELRTEIGDPKGRILLVGTQDDRREGIVRPYKRMSAHAKQLAWMEKAKEMRRKILKESAEVRIDLLREARVRARKPVFDLLEEIPPLESERAGQTRPKPLRGGEVAGAMALRTGISAARFFGAKTVSDVLIVGSDRAWHLLRSWRSSDDLREALSELHLVEIGVGAATAALPISVFGALGDAGFKTVYGAAKYRLSPSESLSRSFVYRGAWARHSARLIPLWIALAGTEYVENGHLSARTFTWQTLEIVLAQQIADRTARTRAGRGILLPARVAGFAGRGAVKAIRAGESGSDLVRTVLRSAKLGLRPRSPLTGAESFAAEVATFLMISGFEAIEQNRELRAALRAARTQVVKTAFAFLNAGSTKEVISDARDKHEELGDRRLPALAQAVHDYVNFEQSVADNERMESYEELRTRALGSLFRPPLSSKERRDEMGRIEGAYADQLRLIAERRAREEQSLEPLQLRFESGKALQESIRKGVSRDPARFEEQFRNMVEQTMEQMTFFRS